MSPLRILARSHDANLRIIAITDHNASANTRVAIRLAERPGVVVIPGMEVTSREEAHGLAYFHELEALTDFQHLIDQHLPHAPNLPEVFGHQLVYDEHDEIVDVDDQLRQVGVSLGIDELAAEVKSRGGVFVPAHVFRNKFSLMSQLGFIDPEEKFDAVEIAFPMWRRENYKIGMRVSGFPVMTGSDSHFLENVGRAFMELPAAAKGLDDVMRLVKEL